MLIQEAHDLQQSIKRLRETYTLGYNLYQPLITADSGILHPRELNFPF